MLIADSEYQARVRWRRAVESTREVAQQAIHDQMQQVSQAESASDLLKQMGRPMHAAELRRRLNKANGSLQFQKNSLGNWAVLIPRPAVTNLGTSTTTLQYTGVWFEDNVLPEYTVLHPTFDSAWDSEQKTIVKTLKTVQPTMGWRTVLGRLILSGLLSPSRARELFGTDGNQRESYHQMESRPGSLRKEGPIQLV